MPRIRGPRQFVGLRARGGEDGAAAALLYDDGVAQPAVYRAWDCKALRLAAPAAEVHHLSDNILVRQRAPFVFAARNGHLLDVRIVTDEPDIRSAAMSACGTDLRRVRVAVESPDSITASAVSAPT